MTLVSLRGFNAFYHAVCGDCYFVDRREPSTNIATVINKIYQGAQSVLIWLGKEDEHTEGALKVLNSLARISPTLVRSQDGFRAFNTDSNQILTALKELRDDLGIYDVKLYDFLHYAAFLQRKWFSRIWVLQESFFSAATVVFCGYHEISWQAIQESSRVLIQTHLDVLLKANASYAIQGSVDVDVVKLPSNRLSNQMIFGKLQRDSAEVLSLGQLLYYSRYFDATDPRDKVFAILGMWDFPRHSQEKAGRISISPDYKKKTATVYVEATTAAIQESRSLDILSFVDGSTAKEYGLPSWVPNYSQGPEMYPLIQPSGLILIPMANFEVPSRSKVLDLPVQGFEVDEVEQTGPTYGEIMNEFMLQPLLQLLLTYSQRPYPSGESRCEAFCRTVIKDTFRERPAGVEALTAFPAFIMQRVREIMDQIANLEAYEPHQAEALEEVLQLTERTIFELSSQYSEEKVIPTLQRMEEMIEIEEEEGSPAEQELEADRKDIEEAFRIAYFGRRLFRTVKGFFGITTQSVMKGDKVWILAGARIPFVLRTRTVNDGRWEFIGETYIRGIMDGEATVDESPLKRICLV